MHRTARSKAAALAAAATCLALASLSGSSTGWAQRLPIPRQGSAVEQKEEIRGPEQPVIGNPDAPITIVSFSDYQCPYCRQLSGTLNALLERYPDKVRVIYRHFAMTAESRALSEAALCADEQGQFANYHQLAFAVPGPTPGSLAGLAERLGLDLDEFRDCTSAGRHAARIDGDIHEGERLGIQVTPTMFINGVRLAGAASAEKLGARIEQLMARTQRVH